MMEKNMLKYCSNCGVRLVDNAKFCHKCGEAVLQATQNEEYSFEYKGKRYILNREHHKYYSSPINRTYFLDENNIVAYDAGHELNFYFYAPFKKGQYTAVQAVQHSTWCRETKEFGPPIYRDITTYELIVNDAVLEATPKKSPSSTTKHARELILQHMQEKSIQLSHTQKKILRESLINNLTSFSMEYATPSVKNFFSELEPLAAPTMPEEESDYRFDSIDYSKKDIFEWVSLMTKGMTPVQINLNGKGELHASTIEFVGSPTRSMYYQIDNENPVLMNLTSQGGTALFDTTKLSDGEHVLTVKAVDSQSRQATRSIKIIIKNKP